MDEFIREVDEEYRRQRIAEIWKRYSALIVGIAFLLVAGVAGWRYWQHVELQRSEAASARYDAALRLAREGKAEEAQKAFDAVAAEAPGGYRLLARFRAAGEAAKADAAAGARAYDAIASDGAVDGFMQDLARLRGAMLRLDGSDAQAAADLERLATPTNPWRHTARELLGLAALKRGETEAASRWFDQIAADRETPQGLRSRLEIYTALAAGGPVQTTQ
ncbi:tetratricopeptide repeat protein [Enterovirga aerilata]|uniref:Ancillary SecYEG translocon subunit n=1 Tax=Enterovirga aerilata TaxID=2730920 RepID=A0A849HYS7_9HYPH|nr:tetratricopeptide repeat protein [Enterovirga sp. DB1703]NNM72252.1 tetratricopeptide repeat protein [Enterovirga sp. DB1703]